MISAEIDRVYSKPVIRGAVLLKVKIHLEDMKTLRLEALRMATTRARFDTPFETIMLDAESYLDFIENGPEKPSEALKYTDFTLRAIKRAMSDVEVFCDYVKIDHPLYKSIDFTPYPHQIDVLRAFDDNRFTIVNHARQLGTTTAAMVYVLWHAISKPDQTILLVGPNYNSALDMMDRVRFTFERLPAELKLGLREYNKGSIKFDNGSSIISRTSGPNACRGMAVSLLVVDQAAFLSHSLSTQFWTSVRPTLAAIGSKAIVLSTPKEAKGMFYDLWTGENDFAKIELPWSVHPERGPDFEAENRKILGDLSFDREHGCKFTPPAPPTRKVFLQATAPAGHPDRVWFDTSNANMAMIWDGAAWVESPDSSLDDSLQEDRL